MSNEDVMYFYSKCVQAMIYTDDLNVFLDDLETYFIIDEKVVLNVLEYFLEIQKNCMDDQMKSNAYKIVHYFKEKCQDNTILLNNKVNNIIRLINNSDSSKIVELIKNEYDIRFSDNKVTRLALKNVDLSLKSIKKMVSMDFSILVNHSSFYDDESFEEIAEICSSDIVKYVGSIRILIYENSNLFTHKLFMDRVKKVLNASKLNDRDIKKFVRKFKRNFGV